MEGIEKHLKEKESKEKTKKDPLVKFIETALSKGISERKIRSALDAKKWENKMVDNAFKKIKFRSIIKKRKNKKGNF